LSLNFSTVKPSPDASDLNCWKRYLVIRAIDDHAHPLRFTAAGEKADDEFDALPLDSIEPFQLPVRLNLSNLEFVGAWRQIFDYNYTDMFRRPMFGRCWPRSSA